MPTLLRAGLLVPLLLGALLPGGLLLGIGIVAAQDPDYVLSVEDRTVATGAPFTTDVVLDSTQGEPLAGWSYGICHDPALLAVLDVAITQHVLDVNFGGHPFFHQVTIEADGFTTGVIVNSPGTLLLEPSVGPLVHVTYANAASAAATTALVPCDTIGTPPVDLAVVSSGSPILPTTAAGTITFVAVEPHVRGDANLDGNVDLGDPITILDHLFSGGSLTSCSAAADVNDDTTVDIADPVALLDHLFAGGPPPPRPYPECGTLADQTTADCPVPTACP